MNWPDAVYRKPVAIPFPARRSSPTDGICVRIRGELPWPGRSRQLPASGECCYMEQRNRNDQDNVQCTCYSNLCVPPAGSQV